MRIQQRMPGETEAEARARIRQERGDYRNQMEIDFDRIDEAEKSQDRIINNLKTK